MTAVRTAPPAPSRVTRARDLLACEWTRLRSVRSTYWTLLVAVVTPVVAGVLVAFAFSSGPGSGAPPDPLLPGFVSLEYAVIAVGALGVLTFTAEFSTGLVVTTFVAVPRRWTVLAAKATVLGLVTLIVGEVGAFVSFFLIQAVLGRRQLGVSLAHPGVPGAVLADGALLCVCALLGLGVGTAIRHTAGGIAVLVGVIVVPSVAGLLPSPWDTWIERFALVYAAKQVTTLHPDSALFTPALSMLVLLAWPAAALLAGGWFLTRRDL